MPVGITGAVPAAMHGLTRIYRYGLGLFVPDAFFYDNIQYEAEEQCLLSLVVKERARCKVLPAI